MISLAVAPLHPLPLSYINARCTAGTYFHSSEPPNGCVPKIDMERSRESPPPKRSLIVVVDDDAAVRNSLKFSLEIEGYAVRVCSDAAEALASEGIVDCACFVIDQNMPGMNGLELAGKLRQGRMPAPVILITSHPSAALSDRAMRADIPIVEKPLLGNALLDTIRAAIAPRA
jgi:two-component system, LuxR family, response regulator FixJ